MSREAVVVVGASGFGRETLDVLEAMQAADAAVDVVGVVDDGPSDVNLARLADREVAYLGPLDDWLRVADPATLYLIGVGDPAVRSRIAARLDAAGARSFTAVHPSATVGARTTMAEGVVVCAGAVVSTNVRLGRHVHVNPNATIGHDTELDAFVSVNPAAVLSGEVRVGTGVLVGAAATVLQQLAVGENALIGAGAVVTKDVPPGVVVKGVPGVWR